MPDDTTPPNVVLVFVDDQGFGDIGCFGSPYIETPNLDEMASEGAKFTSFYAGAPICTPSRAALMTGSYPSRVGLEEWVLFPGDGEGLHPDEVTIPEVLGEAGYASTCIGKWHLGDEEPFLPTNHGFDEYFGVPYSNDMGAAHSGGEYRELPLVRDTEVVEAPVDQSTLTRRYTEEAVEFVEDNRDGPFFCYLAHTMPHVPLHASEEYEDASKRGDYGDVIEEIDWSVGRVLETLERLGIEEETLVIYTSDNGPWLEKEVDGGSPGHLSGGKFSVQEGGPRVPAIARWPGTIPESSVCSELVATMDLLPTFANLAGVDLPDDRAIDGVDATELLTDPETAASPREHYLYQTGGGDLDAVRDDDGWKLRRDTGALYDLHEDVEERFDVADEHPEVVARLRETAAAVEADLDENARPVGRAE
ncbi:MAG: sulfatase [Halanaeroarchaeum sp.]